MRPVNAYFSIGLVALLVVAVGTRRRLPRWLQFALGGGALLAGILAVALFGLVWRGLPSEFSSPTVASTLVGMLALFLAANLGRLVIYRVTSPGRRVVLAGLAGLAGVLGMGLFGLAWPLDWVNPTASTRAEITTAGYRIRYVQTPGGDFYSDTLEISAQPGHRAFINLNVDSYKCWVGSLIQQGDRVNFDCGMFDGGGEISLAWLQEQMATCRGNSCNLSEAYYAWTRVNR
jgi:hypothetical protein